MASHQDRPQRQTVIQELSDSFLLKQLGWFRGSEDPRSLVEAFIDQETARRENLSGSRAMSRETIRERLVRSTSEYISLIIKTSGHTCDLASIEFAEEELRVTQVRAHFDFQNWLVKILFLVDAEPRIASQFRKMLNRVEYAVMTAERFMAELEYVNEREPSADMDALNRHYPFVARFKTRFGGPPA